MVEVQKETIAVIGLGTIGLPTALVFASEGHRVIAVDKDVEKIRSLRERVSTLPPEEPRIQDMLTKATIAFSTATAAIDEADAVIVCIPLDIELKGNELVPKMNKFRAALIEISGNAKKGALIAIETTVIPGTTKDLIAPIFQGHPVVFAPERVAPNHLISNLITLPRMVAGVDGSSLEAGLVLYNKISCGLIPIGDTTTAEILKLAENSLRATNIAFSNELALICENYNVDAYKVIEKFNKLDFHYTPKMMLQPGAGVGGYCLPKDPILLTAGMNQLTPVIRNSVSSNEFMSYHMAQMIISELMKKKISPKKAKVAILGLGYSADSGVAINSPSSTVIQELLDSGVKTISIHDPYFKDYSGDVYEYCNKADCVAVMTAHDEYLDLNPLGLRDVMRTKIVIDGRGILDFDYFESFGFRITGIGRRNA